MQRNCLKKARYSPSGCPNKNTARISILPACNLIPQADGSYVARGSKYYIGNGNEAALVSTFGKNSETGDYVFFVVDSKHEKYECVKNTVNAQNYVAEYRLHDYPVSDDDILSVGRKAWDDMLNTINYCKFNLGFGSIGLCTHALYESINHAANRISMASRSPTSLRSNACLPMPIAGWWR